MGYNHLTDALTHSQVQGVTTTATSLSPTLLSRNPKNKFEALLSCYPEVVQSTSKEHLSKSYLLVDRSEKGSLVETCLLLVELISSSQLTIACIYKGNYQL